MDIMAAICCRSVNRCCSVPFTSRLLMKRNAMTTSVDSPRVRETDSNSKSIYDRSDWVVLTDDGRTIVCWHPEQEFPYECTKPLPVDDPKLKEGDSVLKIQYRLDDLNRFRPDGPNMEELMNITYTNKHRWFPHNEKRYRKPNPPVDREGL